MDTPLRTALAFLQHGVDVFERLDLERVRLVFEETISPDSQQGKQALAKLSDAKESGRVHMTVKLGPCGGSETPDISKSLPGEQRYQQASWVGMSSDSLNMRESMHLYRMVKETYNDPNMFYTTAWIYTGAHKSWKDGTYWHKKLRRDMCDQPRWRRYDYGLLIRVLVRSNPADPWPLKANEPVSFMIKPSAS